MDFAENHFLALNVADTPTANAFDYLAFLI
jgi:hypothetical protein